MEGSKATGLTHHASWTPISYSWDFNLWRPLSLLFPSFPMILCSDHCPIGLGTDKPDFPGYIFLSITIQVSCINETRRFVIPQFVTVDLKVSCLRLIKKYFLFLILNIFHVRSNFFLLPYYSLFSFSIQNRDNIYLYAFTYVYIYKYKVFLNCFINIYYPFK